MYYKYFLENNKSNKQKIILYKYNKILRCRCRLVVRHAFYKFDLLVCIQMENENRNCKKATKNPAVHCGIRWSWQRPLLNEGPNISIHIHNHMSDNMFIQNVNFIYQTTYTNTRFDIQSQIWRWMKNSV